MQVQDNPAGPPRETADEAAKPSAVKSMMGKIKEALDSPTGVTVMGLITMGLSIYSIVSVVTAYNNLRARANDINNLVANWETLPIVGVDVVASAGGCPSGYFAMNQRSWPGTFEGPCSCPSGATQGDESEISSQGGCDNNQTDAGCKSYPAFNSIPLTRWRSGMTVCALRGGEASLSMDGGYKERPYPFSDGTCPLGYKPCGTGTYNADKNICFPTNAPCPVTYMGTSTPQVPSSADDDTAAESFPFGDGTTLYISRRQSGSLPSVNTAVGFGQVCLGETNAIFYDGAVSGNVNSDGTASNDYDSSCDSGENDARYIVIDTRQENQVLEPNFLADSQASNSVPFTMSCRSGDDICDIVAGRTRVNMLLAYASGTRGMTLMHRSEIFWSQGCETNRESIIDHASPLTDAADIQLVLVGLNITANIIVGLFVPIVLIWNACGGDVPCCPGRGEAEKAFIKTVKTAVDMVFKLMKFIPAIIVTVLIREIKDFYAVAAETDCSDSVTNDTFDFLGKTLSNAYTSNISTAVVDAFQIVMAIYAIYSYFRDK